MKYKILKICLVFIVSIFILNENSNISYAKENGVLRDIPNFTNYKGITYSIRGINKNDRRYKEIESAINEWNKVKVVRFIKRVTPEKGLKNKYNHVFIDVVNYNLTNTLAGKASDYHITLYGITNKISSKHVKSVVMHELGHVLGLGEMSWTSKRVMSPNIYEVNYIDNYAIKNLKYRCSKKGKYYYDLNKGKYFKSMSKRDKEYIFNQGYYQRDVKGY